VFGEVSGGESKSKKVRKLGSEKVRKLEGEEVKR
jgi:hypothetical protein